MFLTRTILLDLIGEQYTADIKTIQAVHRIFLNRILILCFLWICRQQVFRKRGVYMEIYWWFLIPAICLAIFSEKIGMAVKADKKLRKVILVFSAGVILVCIIPMIASLLTK